MKNILFIETNTTGTGSQAMYAAKEKGYKVHFWTSDPAQYDSIKTDNPLMIADEIITIDTYNVKEMIRKLDNSSTKFEGILAFDDYHLLPVAELAKYINVPGHNIKALQLVRYKNLTRKHFKENAENLKFKQPNFYIIERDTNLDDLDISFPCVLKPVDDSASNGVSICNNTDELKTAFGNEIQREKNERGYTLERKWLIEEYIMGQEYSAEMLFTDLGWKLISVTQKETYGKHSVEAGHVTSPELAPIPQLEEYCINLLSTYNLDFGAAHIEFIHKEGNIYLVEINPRLAGDCIPELVKISTGVNMVENIVLQAIGKPEKINPDRKGSAAVQFYMPEKMGTYTQVFNVQAAQSSPGIKQVSTVNLPFKVEKVSSSYYRLGYVISSGETPIIASKSAKTAINLLEWEIKEEVIAK
ncbi:ATP-grasp domain-containing protein [Bacillus anthracis]|uniref:ATP-grasp domain-containing protein n=1 Tax=Bacillus anthracis TaxID=1392 RepID=UPI00099DA4AB|nr:ATP-grasp domain-containing protein [Bacillus anthracis]OPD59664.1 phosphoribosylglycinamide formyltransferase [Bacillus anthracis]